MTSTTTTPTNSEVVARDSATPELEHGGHLRAVIYLRVSTTQQVQTDTDGEGFSLPAQREACMRKANSLDAMVVDEYIDAGESARQADRPQLQAMLKRLTTERDIDYVIVHKIDRLARNRADDVAINLSIQQAGAQIVSVSENVDQTPSGILLHGIMASIAEFYSRNLAAEVTKGLDQKAKKGGMPGLAPIGYRNVRVIGEDGRETRTVEIDPERADLIRWAFDAYATGNHSLNDLTEELEELGLKTRATPKRASKPLYQGSIARMLQNPFYVGLVVWKGAHYPGRHEPLITVETFAKVQAIRESRIHTSERRRKYAHYLKGTVFCGRCGSRMSFTQTTGKMGGTYDYIYCLNRHSHLKDCDLPYLAAADVEAIVELEHAKYRITAEAVRSIRTKVLEAMDQQREMSSTVVKQQRRRITKLESERRRLLQAHLEQAVPLDLLKEQQDRITRELANAAGALNSAELHWETVERNLDWALNLAANCAAAYVEAAPQTRRQLNQGFFKAIWVDIDTGNTRSEPTELFQALLDPSVVTELRADTTNPGQKSGRGLNKDGLVDLMGLERRAGAACASCRRLRHGRDSRRTGGRRRRGMIAPCGTPTS